MTTQIEAVTMSAVHLALDAASLRQQVIATNIANAGSSNFQPMQVSFEQHLGDVRRALGDGGKLEMSHLSNIAARVEEMPESMAGSLSTDQQIAMLSYNSIQFQTLLKGLNKHYQIMYSAASDGKK